MFNESLFRWSRLDMEYDNRLTDETDDTAHLDVYFALEELTRDAVDEVMFSSTEQFSNEK
jgi:hypothetical protein